MEAISKNIYLNFRINFWSRENRGKNRKRNDVIDEQGKGVL